MFSPCLERLVRGDLWHSIWDVPTYEHNGSPAGLSVAMVHRISCCRILVFPRCMVVSTVKHIHPTQLEFSILCFITYLLFNGSPSYQQPKTV